MVGAGHAIRAAVAAALLSLACALHADEPVQAPPLELPTRTGEISLDTLRGKVIYLDFWASWCAPCRKSFPWMNAMQERYGREGLVVLAVNLDQEPGQAEAFLRRYAADFTVAFDPRGDSAERYQVKGMPSSYLIDRAGRIRYRHIGFRESDRAVLEARIEALINEGTSR